MTNKKIINKNALLNNLNFCQSCNKKIIAMVKANAYGHGLKQVVNILKNNVSYFGVANEKEAISVRKIAKKTKILVVGKSEVFNKLISNDIEFVVDEICEIYKVIKECKKLNKTAKIHIAINTGMNRIGVKTIYEFRQILNIINDHKCIKLVGIFTHCFNADIKHNNFNKQMERFELFINLVKDRDLLIHIGGSFCLNNKIPNFVNCIRTGFFLYGYGNKILMPVMKIESKVIKITNCKKGEFVGYGKTLLKKNKQIATIPIGYADGIPRNLSNKAYVLVNNKKCKIIGKICMDMLMVDITNKNVKVGSIVEIMNDAVCFSKIAKTSPYEILTNFDKARATVIVK